MNSLTKNHSSSALIPEQEHYLTVFELTSKHCQGEYLECTTRELYSRIYEDIYIKGNMADSEISEVEAAKRVRMRDIRKVDYNINRNENFSITVRKHAVLLILDPIRAIITATTVVLVIPTSNKRSLIDVAGFEANMKEWLSTKRYELSSAPSQQLLAANHQHHHRLDDEEFEVAAYQAIFEMFNKIFTESVVMYQNHVYKITQEMRQSVFLSLNQMEQYQAIRLIVSRAEYKLSLFVKAFTAILDDDEILSLMNLSIFRVKPNYYRYPLCAALLSTHDQLEMTLHPFLNEMSALHTQLGVLRQQIADAEMNMSTRLDVIETVVLTATNALQSLSHSIWVSNYITAACGMNLDQKGIHGSFVFVCVFSLCLIPVSFGFITWFQTAVFRRSLCW